jgi:hypothetical protein
VENFSSTRDDVSYSRWVRWDRFFDDLEGQLASEWEAERAALDTEAERLRLSRVSLRERLVALVARDPAAGPLAVDVGDDVVLGGEVSAVGADWVALDGGRAGALLVPFAAIDAIGMPHADVLRSARPAVPGSPLSERMTLGFVLRDLVRRRIPVVVHLRSGRTLTGTIDRAGSDHLDLALHEPGAPRRAGEVTGHRVVPFGALVWVGIEPGVDLA